MPHSSHDAWLINFALRAYCSAAQLESVQTHVFICLFHYAHEQVVQIRLQAIIQLILVKIRKGSRQSRMLVQTMESHLLCLTSERASTISPVVQASTANQYSAKLSLNYMSPKITVLISLGFFIPTITDMVGHSTLDDVFFA